MRSIAVVGDMDVAISSRCSEPAFTCGTCPWSEAVHFHQFIQNDEFDCELDGVGQGLGSRFVDPFAAVDLADEGDVEDDAEHVEVDEEFLRAARFGRVVGQEHLECRTDVEEGYGELLEGEDDKLDTFVDVIDLEPHAWVCLVTSECQDGGRDLEDAEVEDDHDED